MSIQTGEQFLAILKTDPALQQELNTALEGKEDKEATQKYSEGELDDDVLELVSGGEYDETGPGIVHRKCF